MKPLALLFFASLVSASPMTLKNTPYYSPKASVTAVIFYTTWCPPCKRSLTLLDEIHISHPRLYIHRVLVDNSESQKRALPFGLAQSVPLILVADHEGNVIKRFQSLPNKTIFNDLISRLEEGRLENGTLPIDQRVDTWKMDRKGM